MKSLIAALAMLSLVTPALAQEPSAKEKELALSVFQTMGLLDDARGKLPSALGQQFAAELKAKGAARTQLEVAAREFALEFQRHFDAKLPQLSALAAPVAAESFTEEELAALSAFYATPVGKRVGAKYADYQGKTMRVMLQWMRAEMPGIIAVTRKSLQERGIGVPPK